ncbi:PD-(D/E)XK nuclease-like domain-containing protein [Nocardia australiensis]|uniref:PD-(D/E)XK nuclease-like domain-containing protein n=1 Tax=Nocardia australiensis TaxID=2887191 RepID=UPI001D14689F|nr:PD-(D/E)XK nuclease-like domain-containing protein [Nocardia australiensis]
MTAPAVHDCPFCRGSGCSHCSSGEVDDREIYTAAPTKSGIYAGVPDAIYHGDKTSLSSSGARMLLRPGGPARFRYDQDHGGSKHAAHFDEGHAAHAEVLGTGLEVVEIEALDWKTKAAQEARAQAYAEGKVPLLTSGVEMVRGMGAAVDAHPAASALLASGRPELSAYATDPHTWTRLRARPDYLADQLMVDYKTTTDASPAAFESSAGKYGYAIQEAHYRYVLALLGIEIDRCVFIAQEKTPPYLISLHENDPEDVELAGRQVRRAIDIWAECTATNEWPGYGNTIHIMRMSRWARYNAEETLA